MFSLEKKVAWSTGVKRDYSLVFSQFTDPEHGNVDAMIPQVGSQQGHMWKSSLSDPDSPNISEEMRSSHCEGFLEDVGEEIRVLENHSTWKIVRIT